MIFLDFAQSYGLKIEHTIDDGKWHRCPTNDKPRSKNGAYCFNGDVGFVQNWAVDSSPSVWKGDKVHDGNRVIKPVSNNNEQYATWAKASNVAKDILSKCSLKFHPYLERKGFKDMQGLVYSETKTDNNFMAFENEYLIVPMRINSELVGIQKIKVDGEKRFLFGQRTSHATHTMGNLGVNIFCEGYATGLSIAHACKSIMPVKVHVCFSAGNLKKVASKHETGVIIADNDESTTGERVAHETGKPYLMPPCVGDDFNDWWLKEKVQSMMKLKLFLIKHGKR